MGTLEKGSPRPFKSGHTKYVDSDGSFVEIAESRGSQGTDGQMAR